ncbi:aldo/keto reductase [Acidisphaera sp. L21]|uniref:aldo/keto reductase n=1 Tax=Acidisphaera sp. L21 TaxID=1641851 RepID=UPI00131D800E|nr:aldo/keto reductase [Acidisphaera sp. L21]
MKTRTLGRTGLRVSAVALGGAPFGYVNKANGWDPWSTEGRNTAIATLNHALDAGINYIDTAPLYGNGNSETLIGEVMRSRRDECVLASKVWFEKDHQGVLASVHDSLKRLQTDRIDVLQVHGRMYTAADYEHIVNGGLLDALRKLKEQGKIGCIGITTEEPWTVLPFLAQGEFDVFQIAYNIIYQAASRHFLVEAAEANAGVVSMRTMTSGVFQRAAQYLAPEWQDARDLYEVSLKFVLSDSRIHSALIGMRWEDEVDRNVQIADGWEPPIDIAALPRLTVDVYKAEDAE